MSGHVLLLCAYFFCVRTFAVRTFAVCCIFTVCCTTVSVSVSCPVAHGYFSEVWTLCSDLSATKNKFLGAREVSFLFVKRGSLSNTLEDHGKTIEFKRPFFSISYCRCRTLSPLGWIAKDSGHIFHLCKERPDDNNNAILSTMRRDKRERKPRGTRAGYVQVGKQLLPTLIPINWLMERATLCDIGSSSPNIGAIGSRTVLFCLWAR